MIRRLIKIWLGVLVASVVCTWAVFWVSKRDTEFADWGATVAAVLSVMDVTMLLCGFRWVRGNSVLRLLSFYPAPLAMSAMMVSGYKDGWELLDEWHIFFAPFFVCLTVAYVRFSRTIKNITK